MSLESISELIHRRRSIFPPMYTGAILGDDLIENLLSNANQAPSHKNTEPWRFHVIAGTKRQELATFFQNTYKDNVSEEAYKELKFKKLGSNPMKASHIIAIGMDVDPDSGLPEWEEVAAVSCAIQNLYLSVTAADLGGYWSSPGLMIRHIHEFIDLGENEKCLGFFYIGIAQKNIVLNVSKKPLEDKVKWYK